MLRDGQSVGSIQEVTLARLLHDDADPTTVRVGDIMARPLPQLDVGVHLDEAYRLLLAGQLGRAGDRPAARSSTSSPGST